MSTPASRDHFADELRGFALLGIVLVNAPFLGISTVGFHEPSVATWWDRLAAFGVIALAQAKFYLIFSFLFGYSYTLFVKTGQAHERRQFLRRLGALGVLGVLHGWLLFHYDILLIYAVLGLGLLLFGQRSERALICVLVAALALWLATLSLLLASSIRPADQPAYLDPVVLTAGQVFATGSFAEVWLERVAEWQFAQLWNTLANGPSALAAFVVGVLAGRHRVLAVPEQWGALWRRGLQVGLCVGLPAGLLSGWLMVGPYTVVGSGGAREMTGLILGFLFAPALSWGYVSLLVAYRRRYPDGLRWLRASGRMSLSSYLGESLVLSLVFVSYGLGLFGSLGAAAVSGLAMGTWLLLELLAQAWLRRFNSGPMEALMRAWIKR